MERKLQRFRTKEIDFLQALRISLLKVKQEANNDLTKLAIRNLPLMAHDEPGTLLELEGDPQDGEHQHQLEGKAFRNPSQRQEEEPHELVNLSQSTTDSQREALQYQTSDQELDSQESQPPPPPPPLHELEPLDLDV